MEMEMEQEQEQEQPVAKAKAEAVVERFQRLNETASCMTVV
jgi:hypothetical protein